MTNFHQQRIRETLYLTEKIQPSELAPVLASFYTQYSFTVARQQLQQLADTLSSISVAVSGFILETDWQRREAEATQQQRESDRKALSPAGESLLSVSEAAKRLKLGRAKVYAMIHDKELPAIDINQGTGKKPLIRIRVVDLPQ